MAQNEGNTANTAEEKHTFRLDIKKKKPKPNAKEYNLVTIEDIFNMLTEENVHRFMKDFKSGMRVGMAMREVGKAMHEQEGKEVAPLKMSAFKWIDD